MFSNDVLKKCWFLAGPTASGKTATALALCHRLNAEIVSMDSMAIYRDMDIGTAKPTAEERASAPHHLIDVVAPHEEFSVSEYVIQAEATATEILSRERTPLFVGGTGLYLRSMLRGVFQGPDADWPMRDQLERFAEQEGNDALHSELAKVDPASAARLHPNDQRRIIRAIEVYRITGESLSSQQNHEPLPIDSRPAAVFWLHPPRAWLHERINLRVELMMEQGLLNETRSLLQQAPPPGRTARQSLGYRELIAHFENDVPLEEAVEQIKIGTRQFAKRQHTWFRNMPEVTSVAMTGEDSANDLADRLIHLASQ